MAEYISAIYIIFYTQICRRLPHEDPIWRARNYLPNGSQKPNLRIDLKREGKIEGQSQSLVRRFLLANPRSENGTNCYRDERTSDWCHWEGSFV